MYGVATPLLEECEDGIHTPEMGTWGVLQDSQNFSNISTHHGSHHLTKKKKNIELLRRGLTIKDFAWMFEKNLSNFVGIFFFFFVHLDQNISSSRIDGSQTPFQGDISWKIIVIGWFFKLCIY